MSGWDAYTAALNADANVTASALCGHPDGGLWASGGVALQGTEGAVLAARFANPNTGEKLICQGVKYMATACNGEFLTGKSGQSGVCVTKSGKAMIICTYVDGQNAGSCLNAAINMANDLTGKGF